MVIEVKPLHFKKQHSPNEVTDEGMVIEVKSLQSEYLQVSFNQIFTF